MGRSLVLCTSAHAAASPFESDVVAKLGLMGGILGLAVVVATLVNYYRDLQAHEGVSLLKRRRVLPSQRHRGDARRGA
jgi:hypothetical protein